MARRRRSFNYREPAVTRGEDKAIPERRPEVLARIKERVREQGPFLQQYSNGEFTSSSIAVGRTFEECASVRCLDAPGYTVHYDPFSQLYWRSGGCFD